jgi:hypothetical protein
VAITAKLSRRFYEQFGDEVADELVNLLNTVDASSKSDLRQLNEANFARFDAKMEQRFAESEGRLERRFAAVDAKMEQRFAESEGRLERRFAAVDAKMERGFADLRVEIHALKADLIKWMFLFWSGTALASLLLK